MKKLFTAVIFLLIASTFLSGCSSNNQTANENTNKKEEHTYHAENGDLRESTESVNELPLFLKGKSEEMQLIYAAAAKNKELLELIPCYCGCGESADHRSNYDCFIYENKAEEIVWDDHGTRCGVCLDTAAESILQYQDGKTIKEIRNYIDTKYKEGYANPTPTPEV